MTRQVRGMGGVAVLSPERSLNARMGEPPTLEVAHLDRSLELIPAMHPSHNGVFYEDSLGSGIAAASGFVHVTVINDHQAMVVMPLTPGGPLYLVIDRNDDQGVFVSEQWQNSSWTKVVGGGYVDRPVRVRDDCIAVPVRRGDYHQVWFQQSNSDRIVADCMLGLPGTGPAVGFGLNGGLVADRLNNNAVVVVGNNRTEGYAQTWCHAQVVSESGGGDIVSWLTNSGGLSSSPGVATVSGSRCVVAYTTETEVRCRVFDIVGTDLVFVDDYAVTDGDTRVGSIGPHSGARCAAGGAVIGTQHGYIGFGGNPHTVLRKFSSAGYPTGEYVDMHSGPYWTRVVRGTDIGFTVPMMQPGQDVQGPWYRAEIPVIPGLNAYAVWESEHLSFPASFDYFDSLWGAYTTAYYVNTYGDMEHFETALWHFGELGQMSRRRGGGGTKRGVMNARSAGSRADFQEPRRVRGAI